MIGRNGFSVNRLIVNNLQIRIPIQKPPPDTHPEGGSLQPSRLLHAASGTPVGKLAVGQINAVLSQAGCLLHCLERGLGKCLFVLKFRCPVAADV